MDTSSPGRDTPAERTREPSTSNEETEPTLTSGDVVIAVMGETGVGKSTFISHFSSNVKVGDGLESCTTNIRPYAARIGEQKCFLVDTPGYEGTSLSEVEGFQKIYEWFDRFYQGGIHLAGIVYLHRISEPLLRGISLRTLRIFKKLCGGGALLNVVIATTMWSEVSPEVGAWREQELVSRQNLWGEMMKGGSAVMRQDRDETSAAQIITYILERRKLIVLNIQEEMASGKALDETLAGREIMAQFERERKKKEDTIRVLQEQNDKLLQRDLADFHTDFQRRLDRDREERGRLRFTGIELQKQREIESLHEYRRQRDKKLEEFRRQVKVNIEERHRQVEMRLKGRHTVSSMLHLEPPEILELQEPLEPLELPDLERAQMQINTELLREQEAQGDWGNFSWMPSASPIAIWTAPRQSKDDSKRDKGSPPLLSSVGNSNIEEPIVIPGSGPSITAQQQGSLLLETKDIKETDLEESISSGDTQAIKNLLETHFDDITKGKFSWLQELKDLGYVENEIAELVLNIEKDSPWIYFDSKAVTNDSIMTQYHQPACVHSLNGELLDRSAYGPNMPSTAAGVDSEVWQSPRSELPEKSATRGVGLSFQPLEISQHSWNIDEDPINVVIEELCGLAGVCPHTRELDKWAGQVSFSGNETEWIASVTYALNAGTKTEIPSYDRNTINKSDEFAIVDSDSTMQNIINVLGRFCSAVAQSQRSGICCDSFTILRKTTNSQQSMIELARIKICLAVDFFEELKKCQAELLWKSDDVVLQRTVAAAKAICVAFLGILRVSDDSSPNFGISTKHESVVDLCSLAVQLLTIGFASYAQAHVNAYHPFFLDTPIHGIYVYGTRGLQSDSPQASATLHRFTCMDDMIQKPVMVFSQLPDCEKSSKKSAYDLLATATDLIDTWGPGELIYGKERTSSNRQTNLAAIWLGGGTIQASTDTENEESIVLHWVKEIPSIYTSARCLVWALDAKMRIAGGVEVNKNCEVDLKQKWSFFSESLENLGAYPGYWEFTEIQAGLAISGQQFAGGQLQFNKTWTWHDGNTWKQNFLGLLAQELPLEELDRPWGLQVSFCTGVSRRVPLRVLLADVMPAVLNSLSSPPAWSTLKHHVSSKPSREII